jgi:hypothetical protein
MSNFNPSPDMSIEEAMAFFDTRAAQAVNALVVKGFSMPARPQMNTTAGMQYYSGELPHDITSLSDNELGRYMGLLSEWSQYVNCQLAESDLQLQSSKAKLVVLEARLRRLYQKDEEGKKRSNPERDDYMQSDRRHIEQSGEVLYWEGVYGYIKAIAKAADNSFAAVSRRITQRGQDIDRNNRQGNSTGHTNIGPGPIFSGRRT